MYDKSFITSNESFTKSINYMIKKIPKKKFIIVSAFIVVFIVFVLLYINLTFDKTIKDISGVDFNNITSIGFQYDNPSKLPGGAQVNDPKKIKEFLNLFSRCVLRKKIYQSATGYYLMAVLQDNNNRKLYLLFGNNTIKTYTENDKEVVYKFVKGYISTKELDKYIQSIKSSN